MPSKGRKGQKAIVDDGKPEAMDESMSQRPESEANSRATSADAPGDHSSIENEEEDEPAVSPEAPDHPIPISSVVRMDDQTVLSSNPKKRPLKRFDVTPMFSSEFSKFQQQRELLLLKILKTRRQLTKKNRQLSRDALKKRTFLDEQKNHLKQLETDITSLATRLKEAKSERARKRNEPRVPPVTRSQQS